MWYKFNKKLLPTLNKSGYIRVFFRIFLLVLPGGLINNKKRSHTQLDSRKQVIVKSDNSYNFEKLMEDVASYESMGAEVIIMGIQML